jgi:uroporphyrinogen decarboxylase
MTSLKNDLLIRALKGEKVERIPVWMMRQAGRYLPDYMKLKARYDFFTRVQTPELATQITLQPVDQVGVDAAIIFSDILVIPQAMGVEVLMEEGKGPQLPRTISTLKDVEALRTDGAEESLKYVMDALSLTKKELAGRVPLIGFAGAPWTILCYMVEGKGSKTWDKAKAFAYMQPEVAHALLEKITEITIQYLRAQVKAGADTVQVFDSWAGSLSPKDFKTFAQPYLLRIAEDPAKLLAPPSQIRREVKEMIEGFGKERYIANLGHGITPNVPVDHAKAFVEAVKEYGQLG